VNYSPKTTKALFYSNEKKIKWIKEEEVGTELLHAHAIIKLWRNTNSSLQNEHGDSFSNHENKVELL